MNRIFSLLLVVLIAFSANAQLTVPAPSPTQTINQQFATSKIEISYSRPSMKGRKIFGGLVPYDKLWRTGANSATQIYFGEEVTINSIAIKPGRYSVFTIPGTSEWEIIINKDSLAQTSSYKMENDVVRFKVKTKALASAVETFTVDIENLKNDSADIVLRWEKTSVMFTVVAHYDEKIMTQIKDAMNPADKKPYYNAARYYYETNKDLNQALEWIIKAEELNPKAYWVSHLKAKIYLKMGKKDEAIAAAESSKAKAKEGNNEEYIALNDKVIEDAKKLK